MRQPIVYSMRAWMLVVSACLAATASTAASQPGHRPPARDGHQCAPLLEAFRGFCADDARLKESLAEAPAEAHAEIERRLARAATVRSRLPTVHTDYAVGPELADKRLALERAAVAMLGTPTVAEEAARYAARHPVSYEREGDEAGPM